MLPGKKYLISVLFIAVLFSAFRLKTGNAYKDYYFDKLSAFEKNQSELLRLITGADLKSEKDIEKLRTQMEKSRLALKTVDFFLRYFEPNYYRRLNGPLPVEWETEVFEKFEKPYRREGAGLFLAEIYLEEKEIEKDSLASLIKISVNALQVYKADTIAVALNSPDVFFLCNRLFILNLAAIYTTGFENPKPERVIKELSAMLNSVKRIYTLYNLSFPKAPVSETYLQLFDRAIDFVESQPQTRNEFDHFHFIRDYVNPLFELNQQFLRTFDVKSGSYMDYSLSNEVNSIFNKKLFRAQEGKGIYRRMEDEKDLQLLASAGKNLFYDPILSGNNKRSCASCHKPDQCYTDTSAATPFHYNKSDKLPRNAPSLVNVPYNHLLMMDGKHLNLQDQAKAVICDAGEMGSNESELTEKVLSCDEYKKVFKKLMKYTPQTIEITPDHIVSALTFYYSRFSKGCSDFDEAIEKKIKERDDVVKGFNLFMGKAQCGTCHFVPTFSGIKPPYTGNEFEVIGVPADRSFSLLSADAGRFVFNASPEMKNAFRTTTVRNAALTKPYMHNGVFTRMEEVIDFYDAGGGIGKRLNVENQTLADDSLKLSKTEKMHLIAFINALTEKFEADGPPAKLPPSENKNLNSRKPGGEY